MGAQKRFKSTRILDASIPEAIEEAAELIRRGGLVAFPTETVYGLGADACNPIAVARIFEAKQRPSIDPLIVHVADRHSAELYGRMSARFAKDLARKFWPGPLTLVVPKTKKIPAIVTAGLETVALRMPAHPAALALIRTSERAVAAPSANPFGYVSPTEARHVAELLSGVDLILDGGRCPVGVESTIVSLVGSRPCVLRAGGVSPEEIEQVVGALDWSIESRTRPRAPGQLSSHYATRTPLEIHDESNAAANLRLGEKVGLVAFLRPQNPEKYTAVEVLSKSGDLREAAANLFAALRRLDRLKLDRLIAFPVPERGLGIAIMDRLRRCSAPRINPSKR